MADPIPATPQEQTEHEEDEQIAAAAWPANVKRTYDEYQDVAITAARRSQLHFDSVQTVALQALQNAVSTADMVAKQSIKHSDVSVTANLGVGVAAEAVASVVVKALDANNTVLMKSLDASIAPVLAVLSDLVKALSQQTTAQAPKA